MKFAETDRLVRWSALVGCSDEGGGRAGESDGDGTEVGLSDAGDFGRNEEEEKKTERRKRNRERINDSLNDNGVRRSFKIILASFATMK